jgi:hypothetical protein
VPGLRRRDEPLSELGPSLAWLVLMAVSMPLVVWWWTQGVWGDFSALRPLHTVLDAGPRVGLGRGPDARAAASEPTTTTTSATRLTYCAAGQPPRYVLGFAQLQQQLGATMGDPLECKHTDPATGDTLQHTTRGVALYEPGSGLLAFSDGWHHWALTDHGLLRWEGFTSSPPPELLAEFVPDAQRGG